MTRVVSKKGLAAQDTDLELTLRTGNTETYRSQQEVYRSAEQLYVVSQASLTTFLGVPAVRLPKNQAGSASFSFIAQGSWTSGYLLPVFGFGILQAPLPGDAVVINFDVDGYDVRVNPNVVTQLLGSFDEATPIDHMLANDITVFFDADPEPSDEKYLESMGLIHVRIERDPRAGGNDTFTGDLYLIGAGLQYNEVQ